MIYFYLVNCEDFNPKVYFNGFKFIHVKAHTSGLYVAILSKDEIINEHVVSKTEEELQALLDIWIDYENVNPEKRTDGSDIIQDKIILENFIKLLG